MVRTSVRQLESQRVKPDELSMRDGVSWDLKEKPGESPSPGDGGGPEPSRAAAAAGAVLGAVVPARVYADVGVPLGPDGDTPADGVRPTIRTLHITMALTGKEYPHNTGCPVHVLARLQLDDIAQTSTVTASSCSAAAAASGSDDVVIPAFRPGPGTGAPAAAATEVELDSTSEPVARKQRTVELSVWSWRRSGSKFPHTGVETSNKATRSWRLRQRKIRVWVI